MWLMEDVKRFYLLMQIKLLRILKTGVPFCNGLSEKIHWLLLNATRCVVWNLVSAPEAKTKWTHICIVVESTNAAVKIIVSSSKSNIGRKIDQSVRSQKLWIWIQESSLNYHIFDFLFRLKRRSILKNIILLNLSSNDGFSIILYSFPFTTFAKIVRFVVMFFIFINFNFLLFSFFDIWIIFLQNWF